MCAMRWPCLIDSARLPRQPWFPVVVFAERRWLRWVSVAPAALSSSPPPPLLHPPLSLSHQAPLIPRLHLSVLATYSRHRQKGKAVAQRQNRRRVWTINFVNSWCWERGHMHPPNILNKRTRPVIPNKSEMWQLSRLPWTMMSVHLGSVYSQALSLWHL